MKNSILVLGIMAAFLVSCSSEPRGPEPSTTPAEPDLSNLAYDTLYGPHNLHVTNACGKPKQLGGTMQHEQWMDCANRANEIVDAAKKIYRLESTESAGHNMDTAVQLNQDRKNLDAEIKAFHTEFGR